MKKLITFFSFSTLFAMTGISQCPAGQVEVTITVATDGWGYECFWDVTPAGNPCGTGALGTFGNLTEMDCNAGGLQVATDGNGYAANATIIENIGCQTIGDCFDIHYVDDYGDGGASFTVAYDGIPTMPMAGVDAGNTMSFCAEDLDFDCPAGQAKVFIDVATDGYGTEIFWDLTPTGNDCGVGAIGTYGNTTEMDCSTGAAQAATGAGYPNNTTVTEIIGCLTVGNCFDIHFVDDYGDGGATFTVKIEGVALSPMVAADTLSTFTFCINEFDASVSSGATALEYTKIPLLQAGNIVTPVTIKSEGIQSLTGVTVAVTVLNGANVVFTGSSSATTLAAGANASANAGTFTPTSAGVHTVNYVVSSTETDGNATNNMYSYTIDITDSIYARDNNVKAGQIGIGAGEVGYLGNKYTIVNEIDLSSVSVLIGNTDGTLTDSVFTVEIFSMSGGLPTTSIGSVSGVISATPDMWYTLKMPQVLTLAPGDYLVALKETPGYQTQIGWSESVFTAGTVFASWETQPWSTTEDLGFNITFMIRPNLNFPLNVDKVEESELAIYPNPTETEINITKIANGSTVEIYNNVGQLVYSTVAKADYLTIDVSKFEKGMYVVKSNSQNKVGVSKFIKR